MRRLVLVVPFCLAMLATRSHAAQPGFGALPGAMCREAIGAVEAASGLPAGLMTAIATVESGRRDPVSGEVRPWPWTADIEGTGSFYNSKAEAIAAVRRARQQGARSIDVGCMQVNLQQHPEAFASLEQAFDPTANAAFAARFLQDLHAQSGNWTKAAAMYHSATPAIGAEYQRKVLAVWSEGQRSNFGGSPVARAWAASLGSPFGSGGGRVAGFAGFRMPGARLVAAAGGSAGGGAGGVTGRTLAAYRAMPVALGPRAVFGLRR